jgi:hypothetical protein
MYDIRCTIYDVRYTMYEMRYTIYDFGSKTKIRKILSSLLLSARTSYISLYDLYGYQFTIYEIIDVTYEGYTFPSREGLGVCLF